MRNARIANQMQSLWCPKNYFKLSDPTAQKEKSFSEKEDGREGGKE
jgi:hypothetical protein